MVTISTSADFCEDKVKHERCLPCCPLSDTLFEIMMMSLRILLEWDIEIDTYKWVLQKINKGSMIYRRGWWTGSESMNSVVLSAINYCMALNMSLYFFEFSFLLSTIFALCSIKKIEWRELCTGVFSFKFVYLERGSWGGAGGWGEKENPRQFLNCQHRA